MKAAAFQARRMLVAMFFVALLVLALTLAAPVAAQEETINETQTVTQDKDASSEPEQSVQGRVQQAGDATEQAATRATDSLQDAAVTIESPGGMVDRIQIAAADCDVEKGATVTVQDGDDNPATFVNSGDDSRGDDVIATMSSAQGQIVIDDFVVNTLDEFGAEGNKDSEVIDSTGITCGREAAADVGDDGNDARTVARTADDLLEFSCAELLVLFRADGGRQYGDASRFADSDVRARIEVCLEREIVRGTAADEELPDTGGLSLVGLAVLGVVSAAAGLSVIRGGRR